MRRDTEDAAAVTIVLAAFSAGSAIRVALMDTGRNGSNGAPRVPKMRDM